MKEDNFLPTGHENFLALSYWLDYSCLIMEAMIVIN